MFSHNFKYTLKILFKKKALIFWIFAFPIILGTFFNMAFSDISNSEKLKIIDIAIINNEEYQNNEIYKSTFSYLSDKNNKNRLFNIEYVNEEEASKLLEDNKITGYLKLIDNKPNLVITSNGINETVFKYVVEEVEETNSIVNNLVYDDIKKGKEVNYNEIYKKVSLMISGDIELNHVESNNLDLMMVEFYTLIAMTCLYGAMISMTAINNSLANMSNQGKRVSVAPTKKIKVILSSLAASYVTQIIGLILLFLYTIFVLKVDYGNHFMYTVLLTLCGSLAGLTLGTFISVLLKTNENHKIGIIISFTMLCSFLSGMMGVTMKYVIDKNIPIVNTINPANMITDGFYALYYYSTYNRYFFNIISLLIFSLILIILSYISLRRQKYDSI